MKMEAHTEERTKIAGVTRDDPATGINRQDIIRRYVRPGTRLIPRLEPDNPADPAAVALWLEHAGQWFHLGYIPKNRAGDVAQRLRAGRQLEISVTAVTGGVRDKPTRGVNILIRQPVPVKVAAYPKVARKKPRLLVRTITILAIVLAIFCLCLFAYGIVDVTLRDVGLLPTYTPTPR